MMSKPLLYDIIESPAHPDLAALSGSLGFERLAFTAQRKAISELRRRPPDVVIADFFYGYGNNYAGANVSNLDVLLRSLQRFAPAARIVILADRHEIQHVHRLAELFELHAIIAVPADPAQLEAALS
jgi:DNA-binding NarL/FixJ family response regulator